MTDDTDFGSYDREPDYVPLIGSPSVGRSRRKGRRRLSRAHSLAKALRIFERRLRLVT